MYQNDWKYYIIFVSNILQMEKKFINGVVFMQFYFQYIDIHI